MPETPIKHPRRGYFGIALWHPKTSANLGTAIRSAYAFGAAYVATIGHRYHRQPSDTTEAWRHIPVWHFPTEEDFLAHPAMHCRLVAVELRPDAKHLPGWSHPERACYIFGPEDGSLSESFVAQCQNRIVIPGAAWCLNVSASVSIVLYDRVAKQIAAGGEARRPLYFIDYQGI